MRPSVALAAVLAGGSLLSEELAVEGASRGFGSEAEVFVEEDL
jgi:hypothetical protein